MKKLADEAITNINEKVATHVNSLCATEDEVYMAAMACRIRELEKSLTYMVANIGQPRSIETQDGFAEAYDLIKD